MTLSISVAQPSDAANRAITIGNQALFDVVNWTNDSWAKLFLGTGPVYNIHSQGELYCGR